MKKTLNFHHIIGISPLSYNDAEFERFDVFYSEDLIHGVLKNNCDFAMSDTLTQNEHIDDNGTKTYSTIFSGLFAKVELSKRFNALLCIRNDIKDKNIFEKLYLIKYQFPYNELRLKLDSTEFEEIFDVYASDQIAAMQLLTADVMQDLIQFYNQMHIKYELTIKENHLYFRFWCDNMFEVANLNKFSLDKDTLYKYYKMLDFTFSLTYKMMNLLEETQYN